MSRYQAYPEYKDSGVEWLGRRPSHWISTAIKYGYEVTLGKMLQKEENLPTDEFKPYLKAVNIQPSGVSISSVEEMWFSIHELRSLRLRKGDLLISEGGDVGRSAIWNDELPECYIQNAINRARPRRNQSSSFLYYWMVMLKESLYIEVLCNKATIAHYTVDKLESSPLFLPPDSEAETIAAFLDHETAKIDALIKKQQRLIELLKEKRQAVISHAVTKGLNPNTPMKGSGVEWLGEVPAHWVVAKFKHLVVDSAAGPYGASLTKSMYTTSGIRVYGQQQVIPGDFSIGDYYIPEEKFETMRRYEVFPGDILISVMGTVGKVAVVPENIERGIINPRLVKYKISLEKLMPEFAKQFILCDASQSFLLFSAQGSTMDGLNMQIIGDLKISYPSIEEQSEILEFISSQSKRFFLMIERAESAVELLAERRTALISAAVTGKIDVRDWQAAA